LDINEEQNRVLEHHLFVKEQRFFNLLHLYEKEIVEDKHDMPHIPDVVSTFVAGKYGKDRVVAPFERNFDEIVARLGDNEPAKERASQYIRALSRNNSLSLQERKNIVAKLVSQLSKAQPDVFLQPSKIVSGRRTHIHDIRLSVRDQSSLKDLYGLANQTKQ